MSDYIKLARLQNKMKSPVIAFALGVTIPFAGLIYSGKALESFLSIVLILVMMSVGVFDPMFLSITIILAWAATAYLGVVASKQFNEDLIDEQELNDTLRDMGDDEEDSDELGSFFKDEDGEIIPEGMSSANDDIIPEEGIVANRDEEIIPEEGLVAKRDEDVEPIKGIVATREEDEVSESKKY